VTQLSSIPTDITPARRLHEHVELVRRMSMSQDPHMMLKTVSEKMGFVMAADVRVSFNRNGLDNGSVRLTRSTRFAEDLNPWKQRDQLPVFEHGLLCDLMRAGRPLKIDRLEIDPDDPAYDHVSGMRSLIATPLYQDGEPSYMVALMRSEPAAFTLDELTSFVLTGNLVGRVAGNLVMAQKLEQAYAALDREFNMVGQIQRGLLPAHPPEIRGTVIATSYETSTRAGGDYYDFYPLCNGRWGAILADVSGHGPGAAVVMAMMRTLLRTAAEDFELAASPAKLLAYLNRRLMDSVHAGQFATAFALVIDPTERTVVYANAGHNPPRWLQGKTQRVSPLDGEQGFPLAIAEDFEAADHTIHPGIDDRILLYTDGITEAMDPKGVMFGTAGLDATLHCCARTPQGLIDEIRRAVHEHCGSAAADDDRTLVAIAFSQ
jgi:sigma-B regulation protein RsbU (phosphoserine phosphatase)